MLNYPTYWITPANWSLDTSFDQWSGFNKQVLWVAEYWDEYVFWWDNGTNYYTAYNLVSSINSNKVAPFFRVRKDNYLPDSDSNLWWNLNATNWWVNNPFCVWGGYIYAVWAFTLYGNDLAKNLVKINQTDMSFVLWNTLTGFSSTLAIQIWYANGKIFCWWATAVTFNLWTATRLNVFNTDLTIDSTLTNFFLPDWQITCVFEQADWKVVISWNFTTIWWTTRNRIVRYNTDWTVDATFTTNVWTWPSAWAIDIKQLSDWKLVLWWSFTTFNGTASQRVIILNTDWTIATAVASWFNTGQVNSIAIDWSNNIFCGWTFASYAWTGRQALAKLSSTLALDTTYNAVINSWSVYSVFIDWTVLYICCDSWKTANWSAVSCIFSTDITNWTLLDNFQGWFNLWWAVTTGRKVVVDSNYIYVYWWTNFSTYWRNRSFDWETTTLVSYLNKEWLLIKNLDKFYSTAWTFNISGAITDWDTNYIFTSANTWYWLVLPKWVVKFDNKILDTTFIPNINGSVDWWIYDWWLVIVWAFTSPKNRICKLLSDWTVDATFDVWTWLWAQAYWITKLSNWNYLITGNFTTYKSVTTNRIMVVDNVWTKVWTFIEWTGLSASNLCKNLELSNWNYLIYWNQTTYKWVACNRAIQLDATGTQVTRLSDNFNARVRKAVEYNWKVYLVWDFTTFWATTVNRIACIDLATWTLENIFWTGLNWTWNDIIVDNWGKLLVVWNFTTYNWNTVGYVARIFI